MKLALLLWSALTVTLLAERAKFDDGKYSLDFPDGWKAPEGEIEKPAPLILRQNADGTALFAVNKIPVPEGAQVDLDATAKTIAESHQKDLKLEKAPEPGEGEIDGLPARFITVVPPTAPAPKEGEADEDAPPPIAYFIVLVDTGKGILTLQATLAMPAAKETREAALAIIQSFKRED
jgi:hypothetical protein